MTLKLNGTNSEAAPAYAGDDADTGLQCGTNELKLVTGGTARATVDSSGNLGIGTSSPANQLELANGDTTIRLNATAGGNAFLKFLSNTGNNNYINFGDTADDDIGSIVYVHADNTLRFTVNASEKMRILSSGGITFNGDTAAANALDDYEEGTWTPTSGSGMGTFTNASGGYTKIGRLVTVTFGFTTSSLLISGNSKFSGLPFDPNDLVAGTSVEATGVAFNDDRIYCMQVLGGSDIVVVESDRPIQGSTNTGAQFIRGSMTYMTDE